jgi:hypothetical protein
MLLNKIKWVVGMAAIFLLILATSIFDRNHFTAMKETVNTIYEDRLVAKGYIYDITLLISEKRLALATTDSAFFATKNQAVNAQVIDLIKLFYGTKLTRIESEYLASFKDHFESLVKIEQEKFINGRVVRDESLRKSFDARLDQLMVDLKELSKIQLKEGKQQVIIAEQSIGSIELFTRIEIIFLIVVGIAIQVVILYPSKKEQIDG